MDATHATATSTARLKVAATFARTWMMKLGKRVEGGTETMVIRTDTTVIIPSTVPSTHTWGRSYGIY
jgi:hypothetical protein